MHNMNIVIANRRIAGDDHRVISDMNICCLREERKRRSDLISVRSHEIASSAEADKAMTGLMIIKGGVLQCQINKQG